MPVNSLLYVCEYICVTQVVCVDTTYVQDSPLKCVTTTTSRSQNQSLCSTCFGITAWTLMYIEGALHRTRQNDNMPQKDCFFFFLSSVTLLTKMAISLLSPTSASISPELSFPRGYLSDALFIFTLPLLVRHLLIRV